MKDKTQKLGDSLQKVGAAMYGSSAQQGQPTPEGAAQEPAAEGSTADGAAKPEGEVEEGKVVG